MVLRRNSGLSAQEVERLRDELERRRQEEVELIERCRRESPSLAGNAECAAHAELTRIHAALRRMIEGVYGLCADCGAPVGRERLQAAPARPTCLDCEERAETE